MSHEVHDEDCPVPTYNCAERGADRSTREQDDPVGHVELSH